MNAVCELFIFARRFCRQQDKNPEGDGVVFLRTQRQLYSPTASYIASQLYLDFVQVIFALQVWKANRISLSPNGLNITFAKRKYHADECQHITKNYQELRTYSPLKAVVQYKRADTEINPYRLFYCPLAPVADISSFFSFTGYGCDCLLYSARDPEHFTTRSQ